MAAMARMLFNLRHVEADEFDEVTQALDAAGVHWYQTAPGLFGISAPGLWLHDPAQLTLAREVIAASQLERAQRLRGQHAQALAEGEEDSFTSRLRNAPLQVLGGLLLIALIVALVVAAPWLLWR
jgi:hypothetical protein